MYFVTMVQVHAVAAPKRKQWLCITYGTSAWGSLYFTIKLNKNSPDGFMIVHNLFGLQQLNKPGRLKSSVEGHGIQYALQASADTQKLKAVCMFLYNHIPDGRHNGTSIDFNFICMTKQVLVLYMNMEATLRCSIIF